MLLRAYGGGTTVVEIPFGPCHFVADGLSLVCVWHAKGRQSKEDVYDAFYFAKERSFRQDFAFGLRQLSDIALKSLSPGINDLTTAMQAMDQMEIMFVAFDQIRRPSFTSGQVAVLERYLEILGRAIDANEPPERRRALWTRAFSVARLAPSQVSDPQDAVSLVLKAVEIREKLLEAGVDVASDLQELSRLSEDPRGREGPGGRGRRPATEHGLMSRVGWR